MRCIQFHVFKTVYIYYIDDKTNVGRILILVHKIDRSSKKHINKEASSQLCREALFERVAELNPNCFENIKTYSNFKGSIKELRKIKEGAKKIFKNWGESTIDDFTIRGES